MSGGVDKTLIYTKFGVDKFGHRRLKSMEKSRTLPEMRPPLRLSVEKKKKKKKLDVLVVIVSHMLRDSLSIVVISMVHCDER